MKVMIFKPNIYKLELAHKDGLRLILVEKITKFKDKMNIYNLEQSQDHKDGRPLTGREWINHRDKELMNTHNLEKPSKDGCKLMLMELINRNQELIMTSI